MRQRIGKLTQDAIYIDASSMALGLGNALPTNIVMTGVLIGAALLVE